MVNFACHATTSPGGISANYVYYLEQTIRGVFGPKTVVVFLAGACGDVTQVDNRNPIDPARSRTLGPTGRRKRGGRGGEGPGGDATGRAGAARCEERGPGNPAAAAHSRSACGSAWSWCKRTPSEVEPTEWLFAKEIVLLDAILAKRPTADVEVQAMQIGPAVLVANPSEFFCQLGLDIKSKSRFPFTFPVTLANGCVGYVPTAEAFGEHGGGYETRLTSYSNLEVMAGPRIVDAALELLGRMTPGELPAPPKAPPAEDPLVVRQRTPRKGLGEPTVNNSCHPPRLSRLWRRTRRRRRHDVARGTIRPGGIAVAVDGFHPRCDAQAHWRARLLGRIEADRVGGRGSGRHRRPRPAGPVPCR